MKQDNINTFMNIFSQYIGNNLINSKKIQQNNLLMKSEIRLISIQPKRLLLIHYYLLKNNL